MNDMLQRLRERKLVQCALACVAAAFALIQVTGVVAQQLGSRLRWKDEHEGVRRVSDRWNEEHEGIAA